MLNKEKYAKEILDIVCDGDGVAIVNGKPTHCNRITCDMCDFYHSCHCNEGLKKWANSEYVEPLVDWEKVPVDTPILVKNSEDKEWEKRYFAAYVNNCVYAWCNGTTSWSASTERTTNWKYAKLAETEEK